VVVWFSRPSGTGSSTACGHPTLKRGATFMPSRRDGGCRYSRPPTLKRGAAFMPSRRDGGCQSCHPKWSVRQVGWSSVPEGRREISPALQRGEAPRSTQPSPGGTADMPSRLAGPTTKTRGSCAGVPQERLPPTVSEFAPRTTVSSPRNLQPFSRSSEKQAHIQKTTRRSREGSVGWKSGFRPRRAVRCRLRLLNHDVVDRRLGHLSLGMRGERDPDERRR
jgi:hypothetical protein